MKRSGRTPSAAGAEDAPPVRSAASGTPIALGDAPLPTPPGVVPAGLVYVSDTMPGYRRLRRGATFAYRRPDGRPLTDAQELARIRRLAIPPAYKDVWICPLPNGHLQATGRDARGRKQYRYHPDWSAERDDSKYARLEAFGRALPRIRARVARDLRGAHGAALDRQVLLATLVRLLDTTYVRVGNESYARENGSYGLTTLKTEHAGVRGGRLRLRFRGKSGVQHEIAVEDPRVARVVRRCQQLPGQELFAYEEADGTVRGVGSADVNDYLAAAGGIAGERFTAKDFRTWHGSVQALELLRAACTAQGPPAGKTAAAALCAQVVREVAARLGNTAAVCRKAYVHPAVLALVQPTAGAGGDAAAIDWDRLERGPAPARGLQAAERRLLRLLALARREARATAGAAARRGTASRAAPRAKASGSSSPRAADRAQSGAAASGGRGTSSAA